MSGLKSEQMSEWINDWEWLNESDWMSEWINDSELAK